MTGHIAYVNGQYLPRDEAGVSIEDRGYQFADGIYEVIWLKNGTLIDEAPHFTRLRRSLKELHIATPATEAALKTIARELIRKNHATCGDYALYMQITRGAARRNHLFPKPAVPASLVMTLTPVTIPTAAEVNKGVKAILHPDMRWGRKDIKSVALLPNILARQKAAEAGAREAVLLDLVRGVITEGSSTNVFLVKKGTLITHPANNNILNGVTRLAVLKLAKKLRLEIEERPFTLKEAIGAEEMFLTSTTAGVLPVNTLDQKKINLGPVAKQLHAAYQDYVSAQC